MSIAFHLPPKGGLRTSSPRASRMPRAPHSMLVAAGFLLSIISSTAFCHEGRHVDPRAFGGIMVRISPDGDALAFSYQGAIWRMAREGGEMTRLTHGEGFDLEPAWSPDGRWIALVNSRNFGPNGILAVID